MSRTGQETIGSSADQPTVGTERPHVPSRRSIVWSQTGSGYSASIDGRDYRVAKYPPDSPLTAPYGAYAEGRFIGSGPTLESVKGRCGAHAARLRSARHFRTSGQG